MAVDDAEACVWKWCKHVTRNGARALGVLGLGALGVGALGMGEAREVEAQGRDRDGTRMQARRMELGTTHSDSLLPPQDAWDWRFVQLASAAPLTLEWTGQPATAGARLVLTAASGETLWEQEARSGTARLTRPVEAGIYYIGVQSSADVQYRLTIK